MTDLLMGPMIVTRYLGPTNTRGSRVVATHRRDSETTYRKTLDWDHALDGAENHRAAAEALVASWPLDLDAVIVGRGHDHDNYYWLVVGRWQVDHTAAD
jgi:hypothetical protein